MELQNPNNGKTLILSDDIDSTCSTPFVSAPSSPSRPSSYFYSAPASPVHFILCSSSAASNITASPESVHFEFGGGAPADQMISADEIFLNGQIRPMKLSSHLQLPQNNENAPEIGMKLHSRSIHRRARSMSPMRTNFVISDPDQKSEDPITTPKQRNSSSKRWVFIKDLLYRSKSEGRERDNKKKVPKNEINSGDMKRGVPVRRVPVRSAHEMLYREKRAQAEEMRRRTSLPYRQGLLGCLGFSSRGFGTVNGLARSFNSVSVSSR